MDPRDQTFMTIHSMPAQVLVLVYLGLLACKLTLA